MNAITSGKNFDPLLFRMRSTFANKGSTNSRIRRIELDDDESNNNHSDWWKRLPEYGEVPPNRRSLSCSIFEEEVKWRSNENLDNVENMIPHRDDASPLFEQEGNISNSSEADSTRKSFVISGGFSDTDWKTFPVFSFDLDSLEWREIVRKRNSSFSSVQGRVGHISAVHNSILYVLGGLLYENNEFQVEKEIIVHRTPLDGIDWESIKPSVIGGEFLPRGEVVGGVWKDELGNAVLIIQGGLHVRFGASMHVHAGSPGIQMNVPLSDVWGYYFHNNSLVLFESDGIAPIPRTSHAGCIVGNELVIYGGMALNIDSWTGVQWDMLSDLWAYDLIGRKWREVRTNPPLFRSYHSLVGTSNGDVVAFGGYKTAQTVAGEPIAFVFSDTLLASIKPLASNETYSTTTWYKAEWPADPVTNEGITHRLEHTAAIVDDTMIVWGGRFKTVSQIDGLWALDVRGLNTSSNVFWSEAVLDNYDAYEAEMQTMHLLVAVMLFMSVLFTALYGTLRANNGNNGSINGGATGILRRSYRGLSPNLIEMLPTKMFHCDDRVTDVSKEEEEEVCPICLIEYEDGEELRCLPPCNHAFHKDCVDSWLQNNATCPACRTTVIADQDNTESLSSGRNRSIWSRLLFGELSHNNIDAPAIVSAADDQIIELPYDDSLQLHEGVIERTLQLHEGVIERSNIIPPSNDRHSFRIGISNSNSTVSRETEMTTILTNPLRLQNGISA